MYSLFELHFSALTLQQATAQIIVAAKAKVKGLVVTPNVDHIVMMQNDKEMKKIYQHSLYVFADGMPLVWMSRLISGRSKGLPERVTGADLLPQVCAMASQSELGIYFLGGNPGVADEAAQNLSKVYPGLKIVGVYSPPFGFEMDSTETRNIVDDINRQGTDILFVGVGAPKQEKWAWQHLDSLKVGPIICIGAAFDFAAGKVKRAPSFVQAIGCEWLWRLLKEPRRMWKRYIIRDSQFIPMAVREVFRLKRAVVHDKNK
jgi:N-acetylglucosaminyldiphosphoundecaprenol N-acetyl-beta-D-mannosaminyltransferase